MLRTAAVGVRRDFPGPAVEQHEVNLRTAGVARRTERTSLATPVAVHTAVENDGRVPVENSSGQLVERAIQQRCTITTRRDRLNQATDISAEVNFGRKCSNLLRPRLRAETVSKG